jgi:plasmid maintenance system antidote protein VapI
VTTDHTPSRACYLRGCRHPECVDANKRYCKQYRVTRYTSGRRRVDATPYAAVARRYAAAGWSHAEMAALAGCCDTVFHHLLNGTPRLSATTAARIATMPARPPRLGSAAYVDATGTRRRGQALHRIGYPVQALGAALDLHPDHVSRILRGRHKRVLSATAAAMATLYDEWKTQPGPSQDSMQRAAREGWRDPQWWDDMGDIDDPAFDPDHADRELNFHERAQLRREEIIHLAWCGHEPEQIRERLNNEMSISTIRQIVQEWRTGQKRDRKQPAATLEVAA